jgi:hypothetical protein
VIFIYDDRANSNNFYYSGLSDNELAQLKNYTMVRAKN